MPVNRLVHFTYWVIGHSHFAMIGFASFAAVGGLLHVWKQTAGLRYNAGAANWAFWLLAVGLFLFVVGLTAAGTVQGQLWQSEAPWIESVTASQPFWIARSLAGLLVLAGFGALLLAMLTGPVGEAVPSPAAPGTSTDAQALASEQVLQEMAGTRRRALPWLKSAYVLTGVAGLGCFLFSFAVLAVWPNQTLEAEIAASRPPGLPGLSESERRGRAIYGREGCLNCHSQLVRATAADVLRFGPPSQAWETEKEFLQLWGTRRISPDLARESGKRSRDWQQAPWPRSRPTSGKIARAWATPRTCWTGACPGPPCRPGGTGWTPCNAACWPVMSARYTSPHPRPSKRRAPHGRQPHRAGRHAADGRLRRRLDLLPQAPRLDGDAEVSLPGASAPVSRCAPGPSSRDGGTV